MKIAKPINIPVQNNSQGMLDHYVVVPDNFNFSASPQIYVDTTSVQTLNVFCCASSFDYGVFRDSLVVNIIPTSVSNPAWNALSFTDRQTCVSHYKYPVDISDAEFATYYTTKQHELNWNSTVVRTRVQQRYPRLMACFQKISFECTQLQTATIYLTVKQMCLDYYFGNIPNILCWVTNTVSPLGPDFTHAGFLQTAGYSVELRDTIVDILTNGNYELGQVGFGPVAGSF